MKRFIVIIMSIVSLYLLWNSYQKQQFSNMQEMHYLENSFTESFYIPNEPIFSNPDTIYPILVETAQMTNSNLFRTSMSYEKQAIISKYIYLTGETKFWDSLTFRKGSYFTIKETQTSEEFISSRSQLEPKQKCIVNSFGTDYVMNIYPFQQLLESLPVYGNYHLELSKNTTMEDFLNVFSNKITQYLEDKGIVLEERLNYEKFLSPDSNGESIAQDNIDRVILSFLVLIISILFVYYVINQTVQIGILKLNGFSNARVWYQIVGRFLLVMSGCLFLVTALAGFIISVVFYNQGFFFKVMINQIKLFAVILITSGISYLAIMRIPLYQSLKKRTQKKMFLIMNTGFKSCVSILIILMGFNIWNDYRELNIKEQTYQNWDIGSKYGMFYPLSIGDIQTSEESFQMDATINQELYPILNSLGSLYINARAYEENSLLYDQVDVRYITVNPNYLESFPIYDETGTIVSVSEQDHRYLVIVPEQYKSEEEKIRAFFREEKEWRLEIDEDVYHLNVKEALKNKEITILWSKTDQPVFSFNSEVFPESGNLIQDPIIRVITEHNSLAVERESVMGGGTRDPLKVKLLHGDYKNTYNELLPTLKQLNLQYNLKYLVAIDEIMTIQLADMREKIKGNLLIIVSLLVMALFLASQNILIYFKNHEKKFVMKRIFGYSFGRTYLGYFIYMILVWIVQIFGVFIVWTYGPEILSVSIRPGAALLFFGIELFLSIVMLLYMENRSRLNILQEGD